MCIRDRIKDEAKEFVSSWLPLSWSASGTLNINTGGIQAVGQASINYQYQEDGSTYTISSASLSSGSNPIFEGDVSASDVVLKRVTDGEGNGSWEAQSWNASGKLDIEAGGIQAKAEANVSYQLSNEEYDDASTYTISSASLTTEATGGMFDASMIARDVVLKRVTEEAPDGTTTASWQAESWTATGKLKLDSDVIGGTAEATVDYKRKNVDYGPTYTISSASLKLDGEIEKALFGGNSAPVSFEDIVLTSTTIKNPQIPKPHKKKTANPKSGPNFGNLNPIWARSMSAQPSFLPGPIPGIFVRFCNVL